MIIKKGVRMLGLKPEILVALIVCDRIYTENGQTLVVTSAVDGKHSKKSKHYLGLAIDTRTRYFSLSTLVRVGKQIREALGSEYYVIIESNHIHIQFNGTHGS